MIDRTVYFHTLLRVVPSEAISEPDRRRALALLQQCDALGVSRATIDPDDAAFVTRLDADRKAAAARWATEQMLAPDVDAVGSRAHAAKRGKLVP